MQGVAERFAKAAEELRLSGAQLYRKVSVTQPDEQSINFTQMFDGTPVESSIPKDIIVEIYKVVGNYRRQ